MVQNKLIELSDKEIGIQNEEIKNIEDDFEELDEVEKQEVTSYFFIWKKVLMNDKDRYIEKNQ